VLLRLRDDPPQNHPPATMQITIVSQASYKVVRSTSEESFRSCPDGNANARPVPVDSIFSKSSEKGQGCADYCAGHGHMIEQVVEPVIGRKRPNGRPGQVRTDAARLSVPVDT
jgi:hypothetical protein